MVLLCKIVHTLQDKKNAVCLSKVKKNLFDLCDICGHSDFEQMQHPIEHAIEHNKTEVALIAKFHKSILSGPDYVCRCCTQTWFKESVLKASIIFASMLQKCLFKNDDLVCRTCYQHLKENRIPPCSIMNSLGFPPKPPELELSSLEERLLHQGYHSCSCERSPGVDN